jgi:hypothetical protein
MRRTFWLAAGFGLGLYAGEKVRRTVVRLTPETFTERLRVTVQDALEAGRNEMRARERQLRETFAAPDQRERPRSRTVA